MLLWEFSPVSGVFLIFEWLCKQFLVQVNGLNGINIVIFIEA